MQEKYQRSCNSESFQQSFLIEEYARKTMRKNFKK